MCIYYNYHRFDNADEAEEAFRNEEVKHNPDARFFDWIRKPVYLIYVEELRHKPMRVKERNCDRDFKSEDEVFETYEREELNKPEQDRCWITKWYFAEVNSNVVPYKA